MVFGLQKKTAFGPQTAEGGNVHRGSTSIFHSIAPVTEASRRPILISRSVLAGALGRIRFPKALSAGHAFSLAGVIRLLFLFIAFYNVLISIARFLLFVKNGLLLSLSA